MASSGLRKIVVIGGTGAQGIPVVKELAASGKYSVVVLTRDINSDRAKELASLPNVSLFKGAFDNEKDLYAVFEGAYGAFVNTDGFTVGERTEVFFGFRIFEIAVFRGVKHYVWGNVDYYLKAGGFDPKFRTAHTDAKGRIAEWLLAQKDSIDDVIISIFTTGPYLDCLTEYMFLPKQRPDGVWEFIAPIGDGAIPFIALDDVGHYVRWIFDNPSLTSGLNLKVATELVGWQQLVDAFSRVTGQKAVFRDIPVEEFFDYKGFPKEAPSNFSGDNTNADPYILSLRENFTGWWNTYKYNKVPPRDYAFLDKINPNRIRTVEEWMRKYNYTGAPKAILKGGLKKKV